jgi:hypothetical protein
MNLSNSQINTLKYLSQFKYLTRSQLHRLGLLSNIGSIYRAIKPLLDSKKPLIQKQSFGVMPGIGQLEEILYLSKYGKDYLVNELALSPEEIKLPKKALSIASGDYFHRLSVIDFHIKLYLYSSKNELSVSRFDYYFDHSSRYSINRVNLDKKSFIIPDGVFIIENSSRDYLYLMEQHNDKDVGKIYSQVINHIKVIVNQSAKDKYSSTGVNRVVIIFKHDNTKDALIKKAQTLKNQLFKVKNHFLLKSNDELKNGSFFENWSNLFGEKIDFMNR